jgi:hypothetical protein
VLELLRQQSDMFSCRYPATLMFYKHAAADTTRVRARPNFFFSTQKQALQAFATFKSFALLASSGSDV